MYAKSEKLRGRVAYTPIFMVSPSVVSGLIPGRVNVPTVFFLILSLVWARVATYGGRRFRFP